MGSNVHLRPHKKSKFLWRSFKGCVFLIYGVAKLLNFELLKMRLSFCRAFLNSPEVIFLDEPTSGLDPVNACRTKDLMTKKFNRINR